MKRKDQIETIIQKLNAQLVGKEEIIQLAVLSAVSGESLFMLGKPGVAKSLIARRLKNIFKGGKAFEYLMSRFSTPDEIFGPVKISQLKEDKYERNTENYLPNADVVFLDEIWKASPAIQNLLLTVLNEKKYRNGEKEIDLPLKSLVSASNELPAKNQSLEALWDRFLIRYEVKPVSKENFIKLISTGKSDEKVKIENKDKVDSETIKKWSNEIKNVNVPEVILNTINQIRDKIEFLKSEKVENFDKYYISDRRWMKIIRLLKASAFFNDRKKVDLMDCFLMQHCLWNVPEEQSTIAKILFEVIGENSSSLEIDVQGFKDNLIQFQNDIKEVCSAEGKFEKFVPLTKEINKETYFNFENYYISEKDYASLSNEPQKVIVKTKGDRFSSLYQDLSLNLSAEINTRKILFDGKDAYLEGDIETITGDVWKKTIPSVVDQVLNVFYLKLSNEIKTFKNKLTSFRNQLAQSSSNLFVSHGSCIEAIKTNFERTKLTVDNLELDLKRLKDSYTNPKVGEEFPENIISIQYEN